MMGQLSEEDTDLLKMLVRRKSKMKTATIQKVAYN
jgi:hypothetical protein